MRTAAVFAALMLATTVAAPSVGAFSEGAKTGKTGFYTVPDDALSPGVICKYENNPFKKNDEINKIVVKPNWTHGPFATKTWVGQRILIKKNAKPYGDGKYKTIYRSPIIKKRANGAEVATFPTRRWKAPEKSKARYRAQVIFIYYRKGSKTKMRGRVRGVMEVYKHKMSPKAPYNRDTGGGPPGWCAANFNDPA
ncbi:MAG: hypothetical protein ACC726_01665 [Chloroflexota bacterium]